MTKDLSSVAKAKGLTSEAKILTSGAWAKAKGLSSTGWKMRAF